jgi:hypothetical protein
MYSTLVTIHATKLKFHVMVHPKLYNKILSHSCDKAVIDCAEEVELGYGGEQCV